MIKLNRIGSKLGAVGLFGVVLAGGMVANQMMSESTINAANQRAHLQQMADLYLIGERDGVDPSADQLVDERVDRRDVVRQAPLVRLHLLHPRTPVAERSNERRVPASVVQ